MWTELWWRVLTLIGTEGLANLRVKSPRDFTPYRLNPLTDFDAVWFICSRILFAIAWCVTRDHRLFLNVNMAEKPEAHRIQYNGLLMSHISWPPEEMSEKLQLLQKGFCQIICKEHNQLDTDIGRHRRYKMTAVKPEVVISQVLQQMDTRFQRLYPGFRGCPTRLTQCRHPLTSTDTWMSISRQPNRK